MTTFQPDTFIRITHGPYEGMTGHVVSCDAGVCRIALRARKETVSISVTWLASETFGPPVSASTARARLTWQGRNAAVIERLRERRAA